MHELILNAAVKVKATVSLRYSLSTSTTVIWLPIHQSVCAIYTQLLGWSGPKVWMQPLARTCPIDASQATQRGDTATPCQILGFVMLMWNMNLRRTLQSMVVGSEFHCIALLHAPIAAAKVHAHNMYMYMYASSHHFCILDIIFVFSIINSTAQAHNIIHQIS